MRLRITDILILLGMGIFLLWLYFPFYFMFISAFKDFGEIEVYPPTLIFQPSLTAFISAFTPNSPGHYGLDWPLFFKNSFVLSLAGTGLSLLIGVPAAFALAFLELKNRYQVAFGFLTLRMLPSVVAVLPLFIIMANLHLLDTYLGIDLEYVLLGLPWIIWLVWSFASAIPKSIFDAARIDGASNKLILWRVILPLIRPGLVVASVFAFLQMYNDSVISAIIGGAGTETVPVALASEVSGYVQDLNVVFAVGVINLIPAVVLAMLVRKHWARALSFGLVK